jgi:hypothetical protein
MQKCRLLKPRLVATIDYLERTAANHCGTRCFPDWLSKRQKMNADNPETAASVTVGAISYRARCTDAGCGNLARLGLRYADVGGRPIAHKVLCHVHGRARIARDQAAGLKVYDDREPS